MISSRLLTLVRCPDCRGLLTGEAPRLACVGCGRAFSGTVDYLDLRPLTPFAETTRYSDAALHADGRHQLVSPPLLSAGVRQRVLRKFLRLGPSDVVLDLGCGSGRALIWNQASGAYLVGVDVSPFFAAEARAQVDLALADLRALPFADGVFTKAFALDVWEHLSREGLERVVRETARVLAPEGQLFVYSHVRKNSPLAAGVRATNRLAGWLDHLGAIDLEPERRRKADHRNPLADLDDLRQIASAAGFRLAAIRYYTPLVGTVVENVLVRVAERIWDHVTSRSGRRSVGASASAAAEHDAATVRLRAKRAIARRGPLYRTLVALTWIMQTDIALFGCIPSGPFFALLVKEGR